jgi:putative ABC transport system ATP-binding protein
MTLELRGLGKSYRQGDSELKILENLDLQLNQGEIVAIVGESGSGKSTLLSLLAGFASADRGEILWNRDSTSTWSENRWADFRKKSLGFVFQNYHLIPYLDARENVALPLRLIGNRGADAENTAEELLVNLGLGSRLTHLPAQLSGGESQRVAIARALAHRPNLILADEPTGSLDASTGKQVLDLLFSLLSNSKQTALIVTHSKEVAARCHRVLTLRQGKLWSSVN